MEEEKKSVEGQRPLTQRTWFIVLMFFLFWPCALWLLWRRGSKKAFIIATVLLVGPVVVYWLDPTREPLTRDVSGVSTTTQSVSASSNHSKRPSLSVDPYSDFNEVAQEYVNSFLIDKAKKNVYVGEEALRKFASEANLSKSLYNRLLSELSIKVSDMDRIVYFPCGPIGLRYKNNELPYFIGLDIKYLQSSNKFVGGVDHFQTDNGKMSRLRAKREYSLDLPTFLSYEGKEYPVQEFSGVCAMFKMGVDRFFVNQDVYVPLFEQFEQNGNYVGYITRTLKSFDPDFTDVVLRMESFDQVVVEFNKSGMLDKVGITMPVEFKKEYVDKKEPCRARIWIIGNAKGKILKGVICPEGNTKGVGRALFYDAE